MPKAYSLDLRERVVRYVGEGHSRRSAAAHFRVSVEETMLSRADNSETETSIRTDLRAIFVSLELSSNDMAGHLAIPGHAGEDVKALRASR